MGRQLGKMRVKYVDIQENFEGILAKFVKNPRRATRKIFCPHRKDPIPYVKGPGFYCFSFSTKSRLAKVVHVRPKNNVEIQLFKGLI